MIGKTIKGTDFGGVLRYLLSQDKRDNESAHLIAGTVSGRTIKQLIAEFNAIRRLRPGLRRSVYHQILRPPSAEGTGLSDSTWAQIAEVHARSMGYAEGQWIAIRHRDHIHILANRVLPDGRVVSDSCDWQRAEKSVRRIEKYFGLTQVESSHLLEPANAETHERAPSQAEVALSEKGETGIREILQDQLLAVLDRPQSFSEFADRLYERRVLVRANIQSTDRLPGLSFILMAAPGLAFSGSKLGRRFTLGNLMKSGMTYDPDRDREGIERCLQRCKAAEQLPEVPSEEPEMPPHLLAGTKSAQKHLETIGGSVVLAARGRSGEIEILGEVTHETIGRWRRRLRRRNARGEEILIRPSDGAGAPVMVLPRCNAANLRGLVKVDVKPFLSIDATAFNRQDLWIRTAGRGSDLKDLREALHEAGIYQTRGDDNLWGSLAGYRPDSVSKKFSTADHIKNRIGVIVDAVVDVSEELLNRLRKLAAIRTRQASRTKNRETAERPSTEKGRSR